MEHLDYFIHDYQRVLNGEEKVRYVLDKYAKANVDCVIDMPPSFLFEHFYNRWPDAKVPKCSFSKLPFHLCASR